MYSFLFFFQIPACWEGRVEVMLANFSEGGPMQNMGHMLWHCIIYFYWNINIKTPWCRFPRLDSYTQNLIGKFKCILLCSLHLYPLFLEKEFRNHGGKKANHTINFLVHNTPIKHYSSSKQQKVTTVEKCIVLHILKPRNPIVSYDPEVKMCLAYDPRHLKCTNNNTGWDARRVHMIRAVWPHMVWYIFTPQFMCFAFHFHIFWWLYLVSFNHAVHITVTYWQAAPAEAFKETTFHKQSRQVLFLLR